MPLPPGLRGYDLARQRQAQDQSQQMGMLSQLAQLQGQMDERQQAEQVRGIMSQAKTPEEAIPLLMRAGPAGMKAAGSLTQLLEHSVRAEAAGRERAHYSPETRARYTTPGRPEISLPEDISGPVMPAQPGQLDQMRYAEAGASQGVKGAETMLNHLSQGQLRRDALVQAATLAREKRAHDDLVERRRLEDKAEGRDQTATLTREGHDLRRDLRAMGGSKVTVNPAVTVSRIQDPDDPTRMLEVDARTYRGGSVGAPGVIGLSGREGDAQRREGKRQFGMQGIGAAINEADKLLTDKAKPPTGSGVGAAVDYAGSLVGYSPGGAVEAQKLKAVGGALVSKVPRMEGPQSDKDLKLYTEMAGMVGDASLPVDRRIAALDTVKLLWEKYERLNPGTFSDRRAGDEPPPGAVRRK